MKIKFEIAFLHKLKNILKRAESLSIPKIITITIIANTATAIAKIIPFSIEAASPSIII